jgi:putative ABC transport system substrate-binding protein
MKLFAKSILLTPIRKDRIMPDKKITGIVWRLLTWVLIVTLLLSGCASLQKPKTYKVGILIGLSFAAPIADGFKEEMTKLGYVEGKNITYDVQIVDFDLPTYQNILKKFIADKVDLIVVSPTEASQEAKKLTQGTDIPVVFTFAFTEGMGLIDSIAQPGGNITGVRFPGVDIQVKRYEIMRKTIPNAKRLWMPYQRGYPIVAPQLEALESLAKADGVTLIPFPADNAAELQAELDKRAAAEDIGMDAILILVEPLMVTPEPFVVAAKFAYEHKIPIGGAYFPNGEYTSLFGVNVKFTRSGEQAAPLADKVLKGTPAGTVPVVTNEYFIQIDNKVAQRFGLTVPEGILKQANEIIR